MATNGNNWDTDDKDDDQGQGQDKNKGGNGLRQHADKVEAENKALREELAKFQKTQMVTRVADAIKAKGYDPLVADLVPESVAGDETALEKWLVEKEKLFKPQPKQEEQTVQEGFTDDDEDQGAYDRMGRVASGSLPAQKEQDLRAAIMNAKTREELNEILRKQGNVNVG